VLRLFERILAEADCPVRAVELHRGIKTRLGEPVRRSSVDRAMWHAVRRDDVAVRRVG